MEHLREEVTVTAADLLDVSIPGGEITEGGLRTNVSVGILYLDSWLRGTGAAALFNLMEDTATAEISRSQIWQWIHHRASLDDGSPIDRNLVEKVVAEELHNIRNVFGPEQFAATRLHEARELLEQVFLNPEFVEFLTEPGMEYL